MRWKLGIAPVLLVVLMIVVSVARGDVLTFNLNYEFSGATPPEGAAPWITATFDDSAGDANTVRLTMSAANLVGTEFVDDWLFNFDRALDPTLLTFSAVDTSDSIPNGISTGINAYQADGDGKFDILFDFPPPPGDFGSKFTAGETVVYDITYTSAITAWSFDFQSVEGGGAGTYGSAAHIQSIGSTGNDSGWIGPDGPAVPLPAAFLPAMGILAVLGVISTIQNRRNNLDD